MELHPARSRFGCLSNSAASFASGGGGGFGGNDGSSGGGGGGGDSAAEGAEAMPTAVVAGGADDVDSLNSDVIILDVGVRFLFLIILLEILNNPTHFLFSVSLVLYVNAKFCVNDVMVNRE